MAINRSPIVGVFDERAKAEQAIEELYNAGIHSDRIVYSGEDSSNTGTGGSFFDNLKNLFTGTGGTRDPQDVANDLTNIGLSQDETNYYVQEYQKGHTIVAVQPGEQEDDAMNILRSNGAYNFRSRSNFQKMDNTDQANYNPQGFGKNADVTAPDSTTSRYTQGNYPAGSQNPDTRQGNAAPTYSSPTYGNTSVNDQTMNSDQQPNYGNASANDPTMNANQQGYNNDPNAANYQPQSGYNQSQSSNQGSYPQSGYNQSQSSNQGPYPQSGYDQSQGRDQGPYPQSGYNNDPNAANYQPQSGYDQSQGRDQGPYPQSGYNNNPNAANSQPQSNYTTDPNAANYQQQTDYGTDHSAADYQQQSGYTIPNSYQQGQEANTPSAPDFGQNREMPKTRENTGMAEPPAGPGSGINRDANNNTDNTNVAYDRDIIEDDSNDINTNREARRREKEARYQQDQGLDTGYDRNSDNDSNRGF